MKKKYGIVSYNIHGNYTNYGSVLQSYALQRAIELYMNEYIEPVIIDYYPDALGESNPLEPLKNARSVSHEFKQMIELSMPAIRTNYNKVQDFIRKHYIISKKSYDAKNFNDSYIDENLSGYIVGSDAVWMIDFFGRDTGFWAGYESMKNSHTISYAVSCGESNYSKDDLNFIREAIKNFKAIGVREQKYMDFFEECALCKVQRVVDPTLLIPVDLYSEIQTDRFIHEPYILLYSRKYDPEMEKYTDQIAERYGCKVVEISLRAQNRNKHIMQYSAGVEEFLSLIRYSENVITNSLHATIFSILYHRPVSFFSRENAGNKVKELLDHYDLRRMVVEKDMIPQIIDDYDFDLVDQKIEKNRLCSIDFLQKSLITSQA